MWVKGNWLRVKGNGTDRLANQLTLGGVIAAQAYDSSSAAGSYNAANISGGLALEGTF